MDPAVVKQLALGGIAPVIATALLCILLARSPATRRSSLLSLVGVLVITLTTLALVIMPITFKFASADNRLPWAIGIVFAGMLVAATLGRGIRILAPITLVAATGFALFSILKNSTPLAIGAHLGAAALAGVIISWAAAKAASPGPTAPAGSAANRPTAPPANGPALARILVPLIGASQMLVLGMSSLKYAQIAGLFAAAAGGACLAWLIRRSVRIPAELAVALFLAAALVVSMGVVLGSSPLPKASLLGALVLTSMAMAAVATIGPLGRQRGFKAWAVSIALPALPIAAGLAIAILNEDAADTTDFDY